MQALRERTVGDSVMVVMNGKIIEKKVYCKDCNYYYEIGYRLCLNGNSSNVAFSADESNKNNNCSYYKRKWWRIK